MRREDRALSLQEFGLSRYESKAYLALLRKGSLPVSDLAYHAGIPRTKAYGTLKKLAKKGLATATYDKPVVYTATPPRDAFGELLVEQETKIKGMRNAVETLGRMDLARRPKGAQGQTYLILDPGSVLSMLQEQISSAKSAMTLALDSWGTRLLAQCMNSIRTLTRNVDVKILLGAECGADLLQYLPDGADVRKGEGGTNLFIFDKTTIMLVNASNGRGILFRSTEVVAGIFNELFYGMWGRGESIRVDSKDTRVPAAESNLASIITKDPVP